MAEKLDPRIVITMIGGYCPVQAEGTIDGQEFYFRARHESWSLGIGGDPVGAPDWCATGACDSAGWISVDEATDLIAKAAKLYFGGAGQPHKNDETFAEWQARRRAQYPPAPSPVRLAFTKAELEHILERFAGANDPTGQAIAEKVAAALTTGETA